MQMGDARSRKESEQHRSQKEAVRAEQEPTKKDKRAKQEPKKTKKRGRYSNE